MVLSADPNLASLPPKKLQRPAAVGYAFTNLFVLPGLGSIMAGQRFGILQAVLATVGVLLMVGWLTWFLFSWLQAGQIPSGYGPYVWVAFLGVLLFVFSWSWSLVSSWQLLRSASRD